MGRAPCCDKASVKKGPWSPEEDAALKDYIEKHGTWGNWITLPQKAGLRRCGKSCRLRWLNYLRPDIRHGDFTDFEDRVICALYASIGSRWSVIAAHLPGRTDNDIKNYWNTKLKKKLMAVLSPSLSQTRRSTPIAPNPASGFFQSLLPHLSSPNQYHIPPPPLPPLLSPSYSLSPDLQSPSTLETNFENPVQHCQVKEDGNPIAYGSGGSSGEINCSSSEASYIFINQSASSDNYPYRGIEEKESLVPASGGGAGSGGGWTREVVANKTWGDNAAVADYGFDEVKQLISPENSSFGFLFDENRAGESVYY